MFLLLSLSLCYTFNVVCFLSCLRDHHHGVDACLMLLYESFNYGGKKARDVGLTCRCNLSNIMPDSIFYNRMGWGMA